MPKVKRPRVLSLAAKLRKDIRSKISTVKKQLRTATRDLKSLGGRVKINAKASVAGHSLTYQKK